MTDSPRYPKRLIEVDLPIKRISAHARREKSIRHGHICTLHIWWARRPLAACRAVLCAALWPDPADELCPQAFRDAALGAMVRFAQAVGKHTAVGNLVGDDFMHWNTLAKEAANGNPLDTTSENHLASLRGLLLDFIAAFSAWEASTEPHFLETARALTQAAHEALGGAPGTRPLVVDPFAGGGSIPLEALRIGADAFASDLNPVAVLLNKVVLEYIPRYGQQLADEVRKWGAWIKEQAEKELAEFYPGDPDGATPIAYLWARTITCEGPGCGAEVPLIRALWLAKRSSRSVALRLIPRVGADPRVGPGVDFEIIQNAKARDVADGTVRRGSATCPCCGYTTPVASVRKQLRPRHGGAADARLFCVVTTHPGEPGRFYRLPNERDLEVVGLAASELERRKREHRGSLSLVPDETLPIMSGVFNAPIYGHDTWGSLFAPRQALVVSSLCALSRQAGESAARTCDPCLAEAVHTCLALVLDRQADSLTSLTVWANAGEFVAHTFGRQALPMIWDWPEAVFSAHASGNWDGAVNWVALVLSALAEANLGAGAAHQASATQHPLPDDAATSVFTDPPYYNAVPYADLSDFFYVWLRRSLGQHHTGLVSAPVAPKADEICEMAGWDPQRYPHKDGGWYEARMREAMAEMRRVLQPAGLAVVVFAHKSTAGWEAQLQALLDAGWTVTGSWPVDTERPGRLRAQGSAALASSVHLVCRPRENPDGSLREETGDWREVLAALPKRIHEWMPRLTSEGVVGADAIFACLGPALEVFSRYSCVEKASGERVELREYLEHVWAVVAREALDLIFEGGDATGFEEDARLTAMWLWTLRSQANGNGNGKPEPEADDSDEEGSVGGGKPLGGFALECDAAFKIAKGLGANLEQLRTVVEVKGETARLLPVAERARFLVGQPGAHSPEPCRGKKKAEPTLFQGLGDSEAEADGWTMPDTLPPAETTLDRVHQSMLLFGAGRSEALRRFLVDDGAGRDERFWRLADSLSKLYPPTSQEKRWVDGVLGRKKGLGF